MKKKCINNEIYVEINGLSIYAQLCDEEATAKIHLKFAGWMKLKRESFPFINFLTLKMDDK
jgi:hypothetical protein